MEKEQSKRSISHNFSENLVRLGYGAKSLIYVVIGILAIKVALGTSNILANEDDALASIGQSLFGRILLGVIFVGLVGYSIYSFVKIFNKSPSTDKPFKRIINKIGFLISAIAYAVLIPSAYTYAFGTSSMVPIVIQNIQLKDILGTIFLTSLGKWIVALIGLIVLGDGLYQIYYSLHMHFDRQIKPYRLSPKQIKIIKFMGRFGTLSRAIVFSLIGIFFIFAAYRSNSLEAKGIDGALLFILNQPYGSWLLGIIALGFISFGVYSLLSCFWFKFKRPRHTL